MTVTRCAAGSAATYDVIVHLAARAGVRPSIADPIGYQPLTSWAPRTCWSWR